MNSSPTLQKVAALLAAIPLICPGWMQSVSADEPVPVRLATSSGAMESRLVDVLLLSGNVLAGEVVDAVGTPQVEAEVIVSQGRDEIARATTNQSGKFQIEVPRGGVYLVTAGRCVKVVRTWTPTAAPPAARDHVTLSPLAVIRGQNPSGGADSLSRLLFLGSIAAAIAIPIALYNNGRGNGHTSTDTSPPPPPPPNNVAEVVPVSP